MIKRLYCIVNPCAGGGRAFRSWPDIQNKMKIRELAYDYYITQAPEEATRETRRALDAGYKTIVAIGGDGTLNEVVNGFYSNLHQIDPESSLAHISCGSGGDFSRAAGIPHDLDQALDVIRRGSSRLIDLGRVKYANHYLRPEERLFINIAGCGVEGEIVHRVNNSSKALGGFFAFLKGTLLGIAIYQNKKVSITVDKQLVHTGSILAAMVANGQYIGSGMRAAPNAVLDDGLFDLVIIQAMSRPRMLVSLPRLYSGSHLDMDEVTVYRGKSISIHTADRVRLDMDGEQPGFLDGEFTIMPRAIRLIC